MITGLGGASHGSSFSKLQTTHACGVQSKMLLLENTTTLSSILPLEVRLETSLNSSKITLTILTLITLFTMGKKLISLSTLN